MADYCLDSNVFIVAKNGPYGMDFAPGFWEWLDVEYEAGNIISSIMVYNELSDGDDELSDWVHARRETGFFVQPDEEVQALFTQIADYVNATYLPEEAEKFLDGADPWIIAQAIASGTKVVTHESRVGANSTKVKIPNVADHFGVECIGPYQLLRELNARFGLH